MADDVPLAQVPVLNSQLPGIEADDFPPQSLSISPSYLGATIPVPSGPRILPVVSLPIITVVLVTSSPIVSKVTVVPGSSICARLEKQ